MDGYASSDQQTDVAAEGDSSGSGGAGEQGVNRFNDMATQREDTGDVGSTEGVDVSSAIESQDASVQDQAMEAQALEAQAAMEAQAMLESVEAVLLAEASERETNEPIDEELVLPGEDNSELEQPMIEDFAPADNDIEPPVDEPPMIDDQAQDAGLPQSGDVAKITDRMDEEAAASAEKSKAMDAEKPKAAGESGQMEHGTEKFKGSKRESESAEKQKTAEESARQRRGRESESMPPPYQREKKGFQHADILERKKQERREWKQRSADLIKAKPPDGVRDFEKRLEEQKKRRHKVDAAREWNQLITQSRLPRTRKANED